MKKPDFDGLMKGLKEASDFARTGKLKGGRIRIPRAIDSAAIRSKPKLLSGGNPQIAKAYGEAPVQAYIAAMPGWKSEVGRRLDALVGRTVPGVCKAVKWNSPFYGIAGQGWFLSSSTTRSPSWSPAAPLRRSQHSPHRVAPIRRSPSPAPTSS